jgi:probable HAF family extracellular repeat protein
MRRSMLIVGLAVVLTAVGAAHTARSLRPRWVATDLGQSIPAAINDRGQVVGTFGAPRCEKGALRHAFLWDDGIMRDLGTLGGKCSAAVAVTESGQVVGRSQTGAGATHAFLWQNGKMRDLAPLSWKHGVPLLAINDRGQVVGGTGTRTGATHAFLWEEGKLRDLGTLGGKDSAAVAIDDRGRIIGWSMTRSHARHAFLWEDGKLRDLGTLGGKDSEPWAINDRGAIIGGSDTSTREDGYPIQHSFLWEDGKMTDLGGVLYDATAIDDRGQIVGSCDFAGTTGMHACLRQHGTLRDLGKLGWKDGARAVAINDRGQVIGDSEYEGPAWVWENGKMTELVGSESAAAINDKGQIVGRGWNESGLSGVLWTIRSG